MKTPTIIITMAGEGKRFKSIGLQTPKYALIARDKTGFAWSVSSLRNFFDWHWIFICHREHQTLFHIDDFLQRETAALGLTQYAIEYVDALTEGQAVTVLAAAPHLKAEDPIMIYNIDTFVEPQALLPTHIRGDGWLPAFAAEGDRWSFVKFDEDFRVTEATEKVRISPYGTIGLYYFSSFGLYRDTLQKFSYKPGEEKYIAPLYTQLIAAGKPVFTTILPSQQVHVLGTPEDIAAFDPDWRSKNT